MNIHIFGHSICRRQKPGQQPHFVDILFKKYNLTNNNLHLAACSSEERVLYFLKKTSNIDYAIIFHGPKNSIFVPTLDRDFDPGNMGSLWVEDLNTTSYYPNRITDSSNEIREFISRHQFRRAYDEYVKYFYTRDLERNRYMGALIQIDQYLTYKKIPVIHCPFKENIPSWFNFTSGIINYEIVKLQDPMNWDEAKMWNRVSPENNLLIADKLIGYIESGAQGGI